MSIYEISFKQAKLAPSDPILEPEHSWEVARTNLHGSVLQTDKGYEMFYQGGNTISVACASSENGWHWDKPLINETRLSAPIFEVLSLGQLNGNESADSSNIQQATDMTNIVACAHMPSVIYVSGEALPYKLFAFGHKGYLTQESKDGKLFSMTSEQPNLALKVYHNEHTDKKWCNDVATC